MGAVYFSLDARLVEHLKRALPLPTFVETGTFEGASVENCLGLFEKIHTVELSEAYYKAAVEKFKSSPKVNVRFGTSATVLRELMATLSDESALYWLDAHWCVADEVESDTSQCPLLDELDALRHLNGQSVVCIDDARLFLCPPPRPHRIEDWPSFHEIVRGLYGLSQDHELLIVNDVMVFYPASARTPVHTYAREHGVNWLTIVGKARDYDHHLPIVREEAERRAAGLDELTTVIAARDGRIGELEQTAQERLDGLHELTAVIVARDGRIAGLEQTAQERLEGLRGLTVVIAARDERIGDLEQTARERLEALQRADTLVREAWAETERRAARVRELTVGIAERDARVSALEQTVRQQLDGLEHEGVLLRKARMEAKRRAVELAELTAALAARDERIAQFSEKIVALMKQEDVLTQKLLALEEESLAEFLARRARGVWSR